MFDIDLIIPCYGRSEIIDRGIASISTQWKKEFIHVTLVNDASPNTDCNYQDLVDKFKDSIDIRVINMEKNSGQGLTRQFGIDNTTHDYFMFMDEDDQLGSGVAISQFVETAEVFRYKKDAYGNILLNKKGKPTIDKKEKKLAIVSGPLFVFDDGGSYTIESSNHVWVNSKLYSREFINKHNIRFNEPQSRHAEDYYWTSCFFHCLDNDDEYTGVMLDNESKYYLWYPNDESQSRKDPHYGFMLAGYTMDGSVNILKYIKNTDLNKLEWTDKMDREYKDRILNSTVYSFYTFLSFVRHVASTDYVPALEQDWYILRDACNELRRICRENFDNYRYMQKVEELFIVKNNSDVQYTDPWITFDDYIMNGMECFDWDFKQLLESKNTYKFNEEGIKVE